MIETSRFLSPENRRLHHTDLIEDFIRKQEGSTLLMSTFFDPNDLDSHMSFYDKKKALVDGIRSNRFALEKVDDFDSAIRIGFESSKYVQ